MRAGIVPAEVHAAVAALAKRPGMFRKPGMFERRHARLVAPQGLAEGDDLEGDSLRVEKRELVLALELEPIPFIRHAAQAPGTQPIARGVGQAFGGSVLHRRFAYHQLRHLDFCCTLNVHKKIFSVSRNLP